MSDKFESLYLRIFNTIAKLSPSNIEYVTGLGVEMTGGEGVTVGTSVQSIELKNNRTGKRKWFDFAGLGAGLGIGTPVGISASHTDLPSNGSTALTGPICIGRLELTDLTGPSHVISFSATFGVGVGGTLIFFRVPTPPPIPPMFFTAALWMEGILLASPGSGLMIYNGWWSMDDRVIEE